MSRTDRTTEDAVDRLMAEQPPADSRQARQLVRRQQITQAVMDEGTMRIEDIAQRFGISLMTAHRDLDELASRGLLRKTRGVVSAAPTSLIEASAAYRHTRQAAEKAAIARAALDFVEPGQSLFLDDSTTVLQMARDLPGKGPLTVITNSLTLMNAVADSQDLTLLGLGGEYHGWCNAFLGRMTTVAISRLRADILFFSMAAVSDDIVFHQSAEMVDIKRAMFDAAARRILLVDSTKFGRRALHAMAALSEMDTVIVDAAMPADEVARLRGRGVDVVEAGAPAKAV